MIYTVSNCRCKLRCSAREMCVCVFPCHSLCLVSVYINKLQIELTKRLANTHTHTQAAKTNGCYGINLSINLPALLCFSSHISPSLFLTASISTSYSFCLSAAFSARLPLPFCLLLLPYLPSPLPTFLRRFITQSVQCVCFFVIVAAAFCAICLEKSKCTLDCPQRGSIERGRRKESGRRRPTKSC